MRGVVGYVVVLLDIWGKETQGMACSGAGDVFRYFATVMDPINGCRAGVWLVVLGHEVVCIASCCMRRRICRIALFNRCSVHPRSRHCMTHAALDGTSLIFLRIHTTSRPQARELRHAISRTRVKVALYQSYTPIPCLFQNRYMHHANLPHPTSTYATAKSQALRTPN